MIGTSLRDLYKERTGRRKRNSSYDPTGGNRDYLTLYPGDVACLSDVEGSGCITHIWMTMAPLKDGDMEPYLHRKVVLRMYWDGKKIQVCWRRLATSSEWDTASREIFSRLPWR